MSTATVTTGARLHLGFQNLSLAHERLYGSLGVGIENPKAVIEATPSETLDVENGVIRQFAGRTIDLLDVAGARVTVRQGIPRHVGLGSGTQLALATYTAIARAYDLEPDVRSAAPVLGRAGRSGVGVATFEGGGFVVDGGHPTERFTTEPPADGEWTVPPVLARHSMPDAWRFVLVIPAASRGRSGAAEERSIRTVVEDAEGQIADEIGAVVIRQLLPAVATGDVDAFGAGLETIGRLNGCWYAEEQGGTYRPPAGELVSELSSSPAFEGAGQSSWGPTVYGLTNADRVDGAREDAKSALERIEVEGDVIVTRPAAHGATGPQ
ncbi:MAG: beta-ribofuranosylaminobenzene 5'-phosphate synthase [Halobacteriales archaeon]|jgi:beta-ribofuranosylaminobenzene 5'-phosphate synthase